MRCGNSCTEIRVLPNKMTKVICHMRCGFPLAHYRAGVTVPGKPEEIEVTDAQLIELRADCRVVFVDSLATPDPIAAPAPMAEELPGDNSSEDSDELNSVDEDQALGEGAEPDDRPVVEEPDPESEVPAKKPKKKPARKRKAKKK